MRAFSCPAPSATGLIVSFVLVAAGVAPARAQNAGNEAASGAAVPTAARAAAATAGASSAAVTSATNAAVAALSSHAGRMSDAGALSTVFRAYYNYRAAHADEVRKPYLYFVDLGLDNAKPRGWVFDMETLRVVEGPFHVAHGRGSAKVRNGVPTTFSNQPGSNASSLGVYLAQETYRFNGKLAGSTYSSVGLRMRGESGAFNDAARRRGIVAHGAPYVTSSDAGRSEGCPAMEMARADRLLPLIANGGVVIVYSPNDERWLTGDRWVRAG